MAPADLVIQGKVRTVDDARPTAEALAVTDGRLVADDVIGLLEVGKYADMVVLSADPRAVPPGEIADLEVRTTFLAGRQVYGH